MVLSLAFILAFIGSAVALLIGIIIFSEVQDEMLQTFGDPLLINETNSTEFTNITPIAHSYVEQTETQLTNSTSYTTIPNLNLSSGEFTAGNKYLVIFRAEVTNEPNNFDHNNFIKARHGSTDFTGSSASYELLGTSSCGGGVPPEHCGRWFPYTWFTVWTAVSGEDLTMQFKSDDPTASIRVDQLSITAIELEDFVENEDWFFDDRTTSDPLEVSTFTTTNPSITFTPNGSDDWLVMANTQIDEPSISFNYESRINLDDTILTPLHSQEGEDTANDLQNHFLTRVYTPSTSSHTFETDARQDSNSAVGSIRSYSSIFAINLDKFDVHADSYISIRTINGGGWTQENTSTIVPNDTEDVFIMAFTIHDNSLNTEKNPSRKRLQVNDVDQPPTQTDDFHKLNYIWDGTDQTFWAMNTMESLSSSTKIDFDQHPVTSNNGYRDLQIVAFTMSAKTFEFQSQVPDSFNQASNIAFTVVGILPVALFFVLFAIFGGRTE